MPSSLGVRLLREPDAGNLHVRFDEREEETEPRQTGLRRRCAKAPSTTTGRLQSLRLFSTLLAIELTELKKANKRRKLVIAFHEKAGRSQEICFSLGMFLSRRVATVAILPSAL